ncbi:MFS transporter [Arthrobacter sp. I2-34]|uniref:MFS transporter n=1 Tax=Arthrobacter hankyongi TaxID=2904801 RepID=A0ABS9L2W0_9MICC|nr:MFS transporter [Arthrobacter hankyongi]MCG2620945.1 MFS transporter [Arthrobacter hankyongi]
MSSRTAAGPRVDRRKWLPLAFVCLGSFAVVLDFAVLSAGVGDIVRGLRVPLATVQLALVTYSVLAAALAMAGGKLSSLLSPIRIQMLGLNLYAIGMLFTASAINGPVLVTGQMVAGVGAALLVPNGLAILGAAYSGRQHRSAVVLQAGTIGFGASLGLLLGGLLISALGWRAPFLLLGLLSVVALICGSRLRLPLPQEAERIDAASVLLPCLGVVLIIGGINQMGVWGFITARQEAPFNLLGLSPAPPMLVAGMLVLQLFVTRQQALRQAVPPGSKGPATGPAHGRPRPPLLAPSILGSGERKALLVCLVAVNLLFGGATFLLLLYAQTVLGYGVVDASLLLLPLALATFAAVATAGVVGRIVPSRTLLTFVYFLGAGGMVLLASAVAADWGGPALVAGQIATGVAVGLGLSLGSASLAKSAEPELAGEIGSVRGLASFLGTALGTALGGTVLLAGLDNIGNLVARQGFTLPPDVALDPATSTVVPNHALYAFFSGSAWHLTPAQVSSAVEISVQARLDALQTSLVVLALASLAGAATARMLPGRAAFSRLSP